MEVTKSVARLGGEPAGTMFLVPLDEIVRHDFPRSRSSVSMVPLAGDTEGRNDEHSDMFKDLHGSQNFVMRTRNGRLEGDPTSETCRGFRKRRDVSHHQSAYGVLPVDGFVRLPKILEVIPVSRSTWYAGVKSGRFPAAIKLGPKTTVWRVEDIREVMMQLGGAK